MSSLSEFPRPGLEEIVRAVLESRRYRRVAPDLARRVAEEELAKRPRPAEALKATKRRLHQIVGAFGTEPPYPALLERLRAARRSGDPSAFEEACRVGLGYHASTRERLPILDRLFREIFAQTGPPRVLLDLGCGLSPLALPWMHLPPDVGYYAYDVDVPAVDFLNEFFRLSDLPPLAEARDVVARPPEEAADVAFLLKLLPTVEQQGGSPLGLLDRLKARHLVVSYPTRSLGGREKGMRRNYESSFLDLVSDRGWRVERLGFETELVFVVDRGEGR